MMLPYPLRLVCLSLAVFFLVHLVLGGAAALVAPAAVRLAERMRARAAARFLLALRLAPAVLSALAIAALCVPSYLRLEPRAGAEEVGPACLAAALSGFLLWGFAAARSTRAVLRSRAWIQANHPTRLALAGIFRPRVVIARQILEALSPDQLAAALRHERAHELSHDNFKRLAILLAPDIVPFCRGFQRLERAWMRFSEWAADDYAAGGDPLSSASLAAALVRVARIGPAPPASFLVTSFVDDSIELSSRVNRLLDPEPQNSRAAQFVIAAAAIASAGMAGVMLQPGTLGLVYGLLERLVR